MQVLLWGILFERSHKNIVKLRIPEDKGLKKKMAKLPIRNKKQLFKEFVKAR